MTSILNKVLGERGRAIFTIFKMYNNRYYFSVESEYFRNFFNYCRFYIWEEGYNPDHYDAKKDTVTTYYVEKDFNARSGKLYHIHVYIEQNDNKPIYIDEAIFYIP